MPNGSDHRRFQKITVRPGVDDAIEPEASLVQQVGDIPASRLSIRPVTRLFSPVWIALKCLKGNPLLFEYREAIRIITDPGHSRDDRA